MPLLIEWIVQCGFYTLLQLVNCDGKDHKVLSYDLHFCNMKFWSAIHWSMNVNSKVLQLEIQAVSWYRVSHWSFSIRIQFDMSTYSEVSCIIQKMKYLVHALAYQLYLLYVWRAHQPWEITAWTKHSLRHFLFSQVWRKRLGYFRFQRRRLWHITRLDTLWPAGS